MNSRFETARIRVNPPRQILGSQTGKEVAPVLWTIIGILVICWLLGLIGLYHIGQIIWAFLVVALVLFVVQVLTGRRVV
jgi:fatty acid desaturase